MTAYTVVLDLSDSDTVAEWVAASGAAVTPKYIRDFPNGQEWSFTGDLDACRQIVAYYEDEPEWSEELDELWPIRPVIDIDREAAAEHMSEEAQLVGEQLPEAGSASFEELLDQFITKHYGNEEK